MRRWCWMVVLLAVGSGGGAAAAQAIDAGSDVATRTTPSVGLVISSGTGTGWVVSQDTVVTNSHVARTTETYFTPAGTGVRVRCYRAAAWREGDVAILKCPTGSLRPLPRRRAPARLREPVTMIGYPGGNGPTVTTGEVVTVDQEIRGIRTVGVTATGAPGSSGSPIVDADGRVIAIGTFGGAGAGIFGVPVSEVQTLIEDAGYLPSTQAGAEWRLRLLRSLVLGLPAFLLGAYLQWRSGYPGILARGARWAAIGIVIAVAGTQLQLVLDGPAHFV